MEIRQVPISDIDVWEKNPRNIKTKDFERLKRQIQGLGVYKPLICVRENGKYITLGGNMRLRALQALSIGEVDISIVKAPDEATKIKYALSDNDRAGEYEEQKLAELVYPHIEEINLEDFKVDLGEAVDMKSVIENYGPNLDEEDEVPEIDDSPAVSKLGDLFTLGKHRLLCGDATEEVDVARLMDGEKVDMVFTDPPYGVNYEGGHFHSGDVNIIRKRERLQGDNQAEVYSLICPIISKYCDGPIYLWFAGREGRKVYNSVEESGLEIHALLIWHKINATYAAMNAQYKQRHEPCLYCKPRGKTLKWKGATDECTIWEIKRDAKNELHPTQKPVALALRAINNHDVLNVWDGFLGSGTTLIACEKLSRICYGMEIEPKYCDVIITRYCNYTDTPEEEIRATVEHG